MKVVAICKDSQKFKEFLENQGSIIVDYAFDTVYNNLDTLSNNIVKVDKFIIVHDPSSELAQEVRSVLNLLENSSGLLKVKEYIFLYKEDYKSSQNRHILTVVQEKIKDMSVNNSKWNAPHMSVYSLETLDYDSIYRTIMGKSSFDLIDPSSMIKYRQERDDESRKSFEYKRLDSTIHTKDSSKMESFEGLKKILAKTENPVNIYDLEDEIPEYDVMNFVGYEGLEKPSSRIFIFTGDRFSGSTSHMTSMAVSAVEAGKSVFILDLSVSGGIGDMLEVANYDFKRLNNSEILNSMMALESSKLVIYENNSSDVFFRLLTYVQTRPNIFHSDLLFINCNLTKLDTVLSIFNPMFCAVVVSSLLYQNSLNSLLSVDTRGAKTLVWLNDPINSPIRVNKFSIDYIKGKIKEINGDWKFMHPIFFEDFEVPDELFLSVEGVF